MSFVFGRLNKKYIIASHNPEKAQLQWLMQFITERKETALGKDFEFSQIQSISDFSKLPITEYDIYRGYAERAANGERDVIAKGTPVYIVLTSGTTGNNKMFPMNKGNFWNFIYNGVFLPAVTWGDRFPGRLHLRRQMICWVKPNVTKHDKSGLRMGAFSGYFDMNMALLTTPLIAFQYYLDENVMIYIHAVFGLLHEDVEVVMLNFVSLARSFFFILETRWKEIVEDIRTGTLNARLDISPELRRGLQKNIWADPARAAALSKEFEQGFDNIIPRILPQVDLIMMVVSGTLQTPSLTLQRKYFPSVPVVSGQHSGSEGLYGICMDPGDIQNTIYTMVPHQAFYEFIQLDDVPLRDPPTKLMHQVGK
jgi:hypothetical protein